MAMKIITGYTGEKHITASDDAGLHKGIFGHEDYVLNVGSVFAPTIQSATEVRIADGELVMQGRHARIDSGYESLVIENGSQRTYRNDLIVARYTKDAGTLVETIALAVIKGTEASGSAVDPAYNTGDIDSGETRDFPLYRVRINGISIEGLDTLYETVKPLSNTGKKAMCVTGTASPITLTAGAPPVTVPLSEFLVKTANAFEIYDNGIKCLEDGVAMISGSVYVAITNNSATSAGAYIYINGIETISHYGFQAAACVSSGVLITNISAGDVIHLKARAGADGSFHPQNAGTMLNIMYI